MVLDEKRSCRICRRRPANTKEHFIPKAAGNRCRVDLLSVGQDGRPEPIRCTNGFHVPVLCSVCNNGICATYARSYVQLISAIQTSADLQSTHGENLVSVDRFRPLEFTKHLISMFLCVQPWEPAPIWDSLQAFVLDPNACLPPGAPRLFLYHSVGDVGRIVPCCCMLDLATGSAAALAEVAWPPLGVVYAFDWHDKLRGLTEVTEWGHTDSAASLPLRLALPSRQINTPFPLAFGTSSDVALDEGRRLPVYLLHVPPEPTSPASIGALITRSEQQ